MFIALFGISAITDNGVNLAELLVQKPNPHIGCLLHANHCGAVLENGIDERIQTSGVSRWFVFCLQVKAHNGNRICAVAFSNSQNNVFVRGIRKLLGDFCGGAPITCSIYCFDKDVATVGCDRILIAFMGYQLVHKSLCRFVGFPNYDCVFEGIDLTVGDNRHGDAASLNNGIANDLCNTAKCLLVTQNRKFGYRNVIDSKSLVRIIFLNKQFIGIAEKDFAAFVFVHVVGESTQSLEGSILVFAGNYKLITNNSIAVIVPPHISKKSNALFTSGITNENFILRFIVCVFGFAIKEHVKRVLYFYTQLISRFIRIGRIGFGKNHCIICQLLGCNACVHNGRILLGRNLIVLFASCHQARGQQKKNG